MSRKALLYVLADARNLLARADNDFAWSHWRDGAEAVAEIDDLLRRTETTDTIELGPLRVLFAPTGSLQEVSISSGWGDAFLRLAARFDAAIADL